MAENLLAVSSLIQQSSLCIWRGSRGRKQTPPYLCETILIHPPLSLLSLSLLHYASMLQATLLEELLVRNDPNSSTELRAAARADAERVAQKLHETRLKEPLPSYHTLAPPKYDTSDYVISQSLPEGPNSLPLETMGLSLPVNDASTVLLRPQQTPDPPNENRRSRISITGITREMSRRIRNLSFTPSEGPNLNQHPMQPSRPVSISPSANLVQALQQSNNTSVSPSTSTSSSNQLNRNPRIDANSESSSSGSTRVSTNLSVKSCSCTLSRYRKIEQVRNSAFNAGEGITDAESWTRILLDREVVENDLESSTASEVATSSQESQIEQGQEDDQAIRLRHREMAFRTLCSENTDRQAQAATTSTSPTITLIPFPVSVNSAPRQSVASSNANVPANSSRQNNNRSSASSQTIVDSQQRSSRRTSRRLSSGIFGLSLGLGTMEEARQRT